MGTPLRPRSGISDYLRNRRRNRALTETRYDPAARQKVQLYNNAPIWRRVNSAQAFSTQLPNRESGVPIEPRGEQWRRLRNGPMTVRGGWFLVAVLITIALFYLYSGQIRLREPDSGAPFRGGEGSGASRAVALKEGKGEGGREKGKSAAVR